MDLNTLCMLLNRNHRRERARCITLQLSVQNLHEAAGILYGLGAGNKNSILALYQEGVFEAWQDEELDSMPCDVNNWVAYIPSQSRGIYMSRGVRNETEAKTFYEASLFGIRRSREVAEHKKALGFKPRTNAGSKCEALVGFDLVVPEHLRDRRSEKPRQQNCSGLGELLKTR